MLVVDDDYLFRASAVRTLRKRRKVFDANNIATARIIFMNELIDTAIIDWHLGAESGATLLIELRQLVPSIRACLFTAGDVDAIALEAAAAGACVIAEKSISPLVLLEETVNHRATAPKLLKTGPVRLPSIAHGASMETVEREHILATLEHTNGNVSEAARVLGVSRSALNEKLKKLRRSE